MDEWMGFSKSLVFLCWGVSIKKALVAAHINVLSTWDGKI